MIVSLDNFATVLKDLREGPRRLAVDTETTGLRPYADSVPFAVIIRSAQNTFYFNFNHAEDIAPIYTHGRYAWDCFAKLFSDSTFYIFMHNAKFDMAMLDKKGVHISGPVHDTMVTERLIYNDQKSFSLANCATRLGETKDDAVEKYISKHKLFTDYIDSNGKEVRLLHYDRVPFDLIVPYAEKDAEITFRLGEDQLAKISSYADSGLMGQKFAKLANNERRLLRTVYEMEKRGVLIDRPYCERAVAHEEAGLQKIADGFKEKTGYDYKDSAELWLQIFKDEDIKYGAPTEKTQKSNPRFDSYALENFKSPLARDILEYRACKKRLDFYINFLHFATQGDVLHAGFNQSGTATGRFSAWEPNLQQLKKDEGEDLEKEFIVRRAIVPRPGFQFLMLDYDQVEYRLMLDMAGALGLTEKIKGGLDVHQATADLAGISRKDAKTINFAILYGAGAAKIAKGLGCSEAEARVLKRKVLNASPEVEEFIKSRIWAAKKGGIVHNWFGRPYNFPDPQLAYRAPNHIVQGGAADVMKLAMNRVASFLSDRQSKMVLTIHDEIVIELADCEKFLVPNIKEMMETVYEGKHLQLTCSVECSPVSLADKGAWKMLV